MSAARAEEQQQLVQVWRERRSEDRLATEVSYVFSERLDEVPL